ncbi:MAG: YoaK family protein, partial [Pseudolabrys sp.]
MPAAVPALLSFVAGFVDSYTVLALFGLFVAQVTGSFVLAAVAFVASEQGIVIKVLAIPVFLLAAVVTTVVASLAERRGRSALAVTLGFEGLVLAGFFAVLLIEAPLRDPDSPIVIAASLAGLFAMGTQSALVSLLMKIVASTNVMTTNTTQIAIDAAELMLAWHACRRAPDDADAAAAFAGARSRLATLFPIVFGFLLGTAGGTLAFVVAGSLGLL